MAKKKNIPEEELLSLIEKEDDSDVDSARLKRKRKSLLRSAFNFKKHWQFLSDFAKGVFSKSLQRARELGLKLFNKILIGIIFLLAVYLVLDFVFQRENIEGVYQRKAVSTKKLWQENEPLRTLPYLYYLEMAQRRNVFIPFKAEPLEKKTEKKKEDLAKLSKGLKLVGILLGENPRVMIEDQETGKTYFLNKGDRIREFTVDSISQNKVILSYQGAKIELM
ncbi:MAG: hypothetical protein K9L94_02345 [Candidatus Omnitrophica bacterium]|nr:hypothetical protein [Candidatus Omnitrophota bacterium]